MAKAELSLLEERDENQRALGCVGLSAFAHVGLLIAILFAPSLRESVGVANGSKAGLELPGESITAAAPAGVSLAANDTSAPVEVMLADANDPSAVALPNTPPAQPAQPEVAKPQVEAPVAPIVAKKVAKAPAKVKAPAPVRQAAIETSDASDIATPVAQAEESPAPAEETTQAEEAPQPAAQEQQAEVKEEAVPLQVALPEEESLTQAQANALQAPSAKVQPTEEEVPAVVKPVEVAQPVRPIASPTGAIITHPANAAPTTTMNQPAGTGTTAGPVRGLPNSNGATGSQGTVSGTTQSRGGSAGIGVPAGTQVRDARSLEAMPGNPLATYPLPDRLANRQGTTVLLGHVRNDGRIENITLEKSSGSRMMDESAAKAFSQWKYKPGQEGYVRLPMQFKLVGDAHIIPAELNHQ